MKKLTIAYLSLVLGTLVSPNMFGSHEEFYSREVDEPKTSGGVYEPEQEGMSNGGEHSFESEERRIKTMQTGIDFEPDTGGMDGDIPVIVGDDVDFDDM